MSIYICYLAKLKTLFYLISNLWTWPFPPASNDYSESSWQFQCIRVKKNNFILSVVIFIVYNRLIDKLIKFWWLTGSWNTHLFIIYLFMLVRYTVHVTYINIPKQRIYFTLRHIKMNGDRKMKLGMIIGLRWWLFDIRSNRIYFQVLPEVSSTSLFKVGRHKYFLRVTEGQITLPK